MKRRDFLKLVGVTLASASPVMEVIRWARLAWKEALWNRELLQHEIVDLYRDPYAPFRFDGDSDYVNINSDHPLSCGLVGGVVCGGDGKMYYIRVPGKKRPTTRSL